ncbi:MAG: hypothetical protein ACK4HE_03000 [Chitinophagaceae bacterium]
MASEVKSSNTNNAASVTLTVKVPIQLFDVLRLPMESKAMGWVEKQVTSSDVTTTCHHAKNKVQAQLHLKAR